MENQKITFYAMEKVFFVILGTLLPTKVELLNGEQKNLRSMLWKSFFCPWHSVAILKVELLN